RVGILLVPAFVQAPGPGEPIIAKPDPFLEQALAAPRGGVQCLKELCKRLCDAARAAALAPKLPFARPDPKQDDEDADDYCWRLYRECIMTHLADLPGRVRRETRCKQCYMSCVAAGGEWKGWWIGLHEKRYRCDYWNF